MVVYVHINMGSPKYGPPVYVKGRERVGVGVEKKSIFPSKCTAYFKLYTTKSRNIGQVRHV